MSARRRKSPTSAQKERYAEYLRDVDRLRANFRARGLPPENVIVLSLERFIDEVEDSREAARCRAEAQAKFRAEFGRAAELPEPLSGVDAQQVWHEAEVGQADPDDVRRALVTFINDAQELFRLVQESGAALTLPNTVWMVAERIGFALKHEGATLDRALGLKRGKGAPGGRNDGLHHWLCGRVMEEYLFAPSDGGDAPTGLELGITAAHEAVAERWGSRGVNVGTVKRAWNQYKGTAVGIWMDSGFQSRLEGHPVAKARFEHLLQRAAVERWPGR